MPIQPALSRSLRALHGRAAARLSCRRRSPGEVLPSRSRPRPGGGRRRVTARTRRTALMPLVEVSHLVKHFVRDAGFFRKGTRVAAVDDVSFSIDEGETFGLVGESGSGKTTTGRCVLRLIEPTSGAVRFRGDDVLALPPRRLREARRSMQIVFQDPYSSLNPRMRARQIVEEPLVIHNIGDRDARKARVADLFRLVG